MSKKLVVSSHSPVCWFLRRVLEAMRSEQTDVPLAVERSSGSRVRFPVSTTRLMLVAATRGSFQTDFKLGASLGSGATETGGPPHFGALSSRILRDGVAKRDGSVTKDRARTGGTAARGCGRSGLRLVGGRLERTGGRAE